MANKKAVLAKLQSLAKTHGPVFVVASEEPKLEKVEMAAYKCDCGTQFRAIAKTQPFCITCGSDEVIEDEIPADDSFALPSDDSQMSSIQCSACGTHNLIDDNVAKAYSGQAHCVTCGEEIEYMAEDLSGDEDFSTDSDDVILGDTGDGDLLETEEIQSADETTETETTEDVEDDVSTDTTDKTDDTESSEGEDGEASEDSTDAGETASVKLISVAKAGELSFELSGDKLTAYIGATPVATLDKAKAGENASVIHSGSFAQAIVHTAKRNGAEKALAHYGFELISVDVPVPTFVKDKAEATIKGEREKLVAAVKTLRNDFRQSLQIAAAGLNKSFFKNKTNVIKAALFEELAALNIRNPAKPIDKVFAAHSDAYHGVLLAIAEELMDKPADVRNQIAEAIGVSNYQVAQDEEMELSEDDDADGEDVSVEETLESAGVRKIAGSKQAQVVTATIADIKKANGGRLF